MLICFFFAKRCCRKLIPLFLESYDLHEAARQPADIPGSHSGWALVTNNSYNTPCKITTFHFCISFHVWIRQT